MLLKLILSLSCFYKCRIENSFTVVYSSHAVQNMVIFCSTDPPVCSHMLAPIYFAESISSPSAFQGVRCPGYLQYMLGWCSGSNATVDNSVNNNGFHTAIMGENCDTRLVFITVFIYNGHYTNISMLIMNQNHLRNGNLLCIYLVRKCYTIFCNVLKCLLDQFHNIPCVFHNKNIQDNTK